MKSLRILMLAILAGAGLWSLLATTLLPLQLTPIGLAAIALTSFGLFTRKPTWALAGLFFASLFVHVVARQMQLVSESWNPVTDGTLTSSVVFGTSAILIAVRPYMSLPGIRRHAQVSLAGILLLIPAALLLDARLASESANFALLSVAALLGVLGAALLVGAGLKTIPTLRRFDRDSDAVLLVALALYLSVHIPAMSLQAVPLIRSNLAIFAALCIVAVTLRGASEVGSPLDRTSPFFQVRLWPIITGALALGLAHGILSADLANGMISVSAIVLGVASLGAMLFAVREAAGPQKPLVIPFSSRDRAFQKLPTALLNSDVRLMGHRVRRTSDARTIGIEARAAWTNQFKSDISIEAAAAETGLEADLDVITLRLAQEHLPAVLSVLEADEPWLSVPLNGNVDAANQLPNYGGVEGLVLRVPNANIAQAVDKLRDHGAQLQADAGTAIDCEPEIVTDVHAMFVGDLPAIHMTRVSETSVGDSARRAQLWVDDLEPPTNLVILLSEVDGYGDIDDVTTL